jgi:regulator of RNase E activity RraA
MWSAVLGDAGIDPDSALPVALNRNTSLSVFARNAAAAASVEQAADVIISVITGGPELQGRVSRLDVVVADAAGRVMAQIAQALAGAIGDNKLKIDQLEQDLERATRRIDELQSAVDDFRTRLDHGS